MTLVTIRRDAGYSRQKAASKLDISLSTLQRWEKGISSVPASAIPKLAKLYKRSERDILALVTQEKPTRRAV